MIGLIIKEGLSWQDIDVIHNVLEASSAYDSLYSKVWEKAIKLRKEKMCSQES